MRNKLTLIVLVAVIVAVGGFAVVAGEADDSPGLQLIGVLFIGSAVALAVRSMRRSRSSAGHHH